MFHEYADIAIATATPDGLVVPVLRDAQNMSFAGELCAALRGLERGGVSDTEKAIEELKTKATDGRLAIEDLVTDLRLYLAAPPCISLHLPASRCISLHLPVSPLRIW